MFSGYVSNINSMLAEPSGVFPRIRNFCGESTHRNFER